MLLRFVFSIFLLFISFSATSSNYLDATEQSYLRQKSKLKIAVMKESWLPYWGGGDGQPKGIEHEFASGIADELGLDIEYQHYDSIEALLASVETGESDLTIGFARTPEREGKYLFSEPLYENARVIWLREQEFAQQSLEDLKWVCVQGTFTCPLFTELGYKNIYLASNYHNLFEMIRHGIADATIINYVSLSAFLSANRISDGKVLFDEKLGTQQNRVLVNKNNELLLSAINKVIRADKLGLTKNKINSFDVHFINDQQNLAILKSSRSDDAIKYTFYDNMFPLSFWDEEEEKYKGYIHDLLDRISLRSILKFEFVPANGRDVNSMLRNGVVDLIPFYNANDIDTRDFSSVGVYDQIVFDYIETLEPYSEKKISILDRTKTYYRYLYNHENLKTVPIYSSFDELIKAMENGTVTHALVNKMLINSYLTTHWSHIFKLSDPFKVNDVSVDVTMIVAKEAVVIKTMLSRALATFTQQEFKELRTHYDRTTVNLGYDKKQILIYGLITLCALLTIGLLFALWVMRLRGVLLNTQNDVALSANQNQWLTQLLDAIPSMVAIFNDKHELVLANEAYRRNIQICTNNDCFVKKKTCPLINLHQTPQIDNESMIRMPDEMCMLGGHYFNVIRREIFHPVNQVPHYLILFNDITELKETMQALRDSNEQALQAIEARNHFLAVVSHELRTPIAAMLGLMEILTTRLKNRESQMLLTNAIHSAERLKLHVNDILDFSKIEAKQLKLDIAQYNLADELGPILRGFEASAQLKHIDFDVTWLPSSHLMARFDALRFNQIVTNLLSNAIKFTDVGRIIFKIEVAVDYLTLVIEDTGCGMTREQIDSLFVPFAQADNSITRRYGGTGLGMSIVANLIDLMDGAIEVHSQPKQGTQVIVSLPVSTQACIEFQNKVIDIACDSPYRPWAKMLSERVEDGELWVEQSSQNIYPDLLLKRLREETSIVHDESKAPQASVLHGHVLVADDDAINRLLLNKQLNALGLSATLVNDGQQAFEKLLEHPERYDLLITDCHMPNLDGFALTRKVRQEIPEYCGAVIACTAEDSRLAAERALQAGMDKVLYKPYGLAMLRKTLSQYLTRLPEVQDPSNWLDLYQEEEREEMALVVVEALTQDIVLLNQTDSDIKALAHRIKGAAGALQLEKLADLARAVEKQTDLQLLEVDKQQLINAMHDVVLQAQQWLNQQSE